MALEITVCNFCGSPEHKTIYILPDLLLDRPESNSQLVRCSRCGLVYQNPRPRLEEMGAHYPSEYDSYDADPAAANASRVMRKFIRFGSYKRVRTVTRYKRMGRLLDIGCSTGSFLLEMRNLPGWDLTGVEINSSAAEIAMEQGLNVKIGTLEEAKFPDSAFDVVTLWDVLEHLHDPTATLEEISRILNPDGIVVLRVPNLDSWDARFFGRCWNGLDPPRHLFVFRPQILKELLKRAGFNKIFLTSGFGGYPAIVLSIRFWMTARGVRPDLRSRIERWLLHPAVRLLFSPFLSLTAPGLHGPHVTAIGRKHRPSASIHRSDEIKSE